MSDEENLKSPAKSPEKSPLPPPEDGEFMYIDSPQLISAAPPSTATSASVNNIEEDDDFEFEFALGSQGKHPSITADEIFSDGQIRPIYPVFNRDLLTDGEEKIRRHPLLQLLIEDRGASTSSHSSLGNDLEGIPSGSYCVWKPGSAQSPETVRKSSSTGSSRRRRIRDFVLGHSNSDGKEKFMFFAAEEKSSVINEEKKKGKEKKKGTELDLITAHRMFYGGNGTTARSGGGGGGSSGGRKSYLPYKPEIVGFFARVNGIGRAHHPF